MNLVAKALFSFIILFTFLNALQCDPSNFPYSQANSGAPSKPLKSVQNISFSLLSEKSNQSGAAADVNSDSQQFLISTSSLLSVESGCSFSVSNLLLSRLNSTTALFTFYGILLTKSTPSSSTMIRLIPDSFPLSSSSPLSRTFTFLTTTVSFSDFNQFRLVQVDSNTTVAVVELPGNGVAPILPFPNLNTTTSSPITSVPVTSTSASASGTLDTSLIASLFAGSIGLVLLTVLVSYLYQSGFFSRLNQ